MTIKRKCVSKKITLDTKYHDSNSNNAAADSATNPKNVPSRTDGPLFGGRKSKVTNAQSIHQEIKQASFDRCDQRDLLHMRQFVNVIKNLKDNAICRQNMIQRGTPARDKSKGPTSSDCADYV